MLVPKFHIERMFALIQFEIPGQKKPLTIRSLLLGFSGAIAKDGILIEGVAERLQKIAEMGVEIHVITADTNGTAVSQCEGLPLTLEVFNSTDTVRRKREAALRLGGEESAAIGNGRSDMGMFETCGLSIAVIGAEGCFLPALEAAKIVVTDIRDALDLLINKNRLSATLRP